MAIPSCVQDFCRCHCRLIVLSALLPILVGCGGGVGPGAMRSNRNHYNMAVQQTDAQELLLNLVRLRYRDTPFFLQVASVSANLKFHIDADAGGLIPSSGPNIVTLGAGVAYEESPTMTYTPLRGKQFVTQMLEPVKLGILLLLSYSGWSIERVFRLMVQEINGVRNAPTASGPTPAIEPEFRRFRRVSELLRALQLHDLVDLSTAPSDAGGDGEKGPGKRIFVLLEPEALERPETQELVELLSLTPGRRYYEIVSRVGQVNPDQISIVPRSVTAAMYYASQAVEVQQEDEEKGRVTVTMDAQGNRFDWKEVTGDFFRVQSGSKPTDAYVSINYRGHWFFISDTDLDSKSTFVLLTTVLALQAGDVPSAGPVLTLPVSR
ncbi:MAG: hypothetical protein KAJ12_01665 [Bacteroidetes bacterium]|nr:hypothetical protein [Bacteroidota bacterium]